MHTILSGRAWEHYATVKVGSSMEIMLNRFCILAHYIPDQLLEVRTVSDCNFDPTLLILVAMILNL